MPGVEVAKMVSCKIDWSPEGLAERCTSKISSLSLFLFPSLIQSPTCSLSRWFSLIYKHVRCLVSWKSWWERNPELYEDGLGWGAGLWMKDDDWKSWKSGTTLLWCYYHHVSERDPWPLRVPYVQCSIQAIIISCVWEFVNKSCQVQCILKLFFYSCFCSCVPPYLFVLSYS